jgi:hypothetical protein
MSTQFETQHKFSWPITAYTARSFIKPYMFPSLKSHLERRQGFLTEPPVQSPSIILLKSTILLLEQHLDAPRSPSRSRRLDINPQGLKILMLIKKRKITHPYHYNLLFKNTPIHDTLYLC